MLTREARDQIPQQGRGREPGSRSSDHHDEREERRGRRRTRSPRSQDGGTESRRRQYRERTPAKGQRRSSSHGGSDDLHLTRHSPSSRHSYGGRYRSYSRSRSFSRSRSPRRYDSYHPRRSEYGEQGHVSYARRHRQRSLTPVAVREQRVKESIVPETAFPLQDYTRYISGNFSKYRHVTRFNFFLPKFRNGDGKVNPAAYGSVHQHDLGLCYCTFKTVFACEMGVKCPWRHHPLSRREKKWIEELAGDKGRRFIDDTDRFWSIPDVPVPGCNMNEVPE